MRPFSSASRVPSNTLGRWLSATCLTGGLVLAGCASAPKAVTPAADAEPARQRAPLELTGLSVEEESLRGVTLALTGAHALASAPREVHWTATIDGARLASGTLPCSADEDGEFRLDVPLTYAEDFIVTGDSNGELTAEVLVTLRADDGANQVEATRSVRLRRPTQPTVTMHLQASRTGPASMNLVYYFALRNPNAFDVRASVLRYQAMLEGKVVDEGELPLAARIPAWAENSFDIPAEANVQNVGRELPALMRKNELQWSFVGSVKVGGREIPIDMSGPLPLSGG